jgi:hypothetical protein
MRIQGNEAAIQSLLIQLVNEKIIAVAGESIEYKY